MAKKMKFSEVTVIALFEQSLKKARKKLSSLDIAEGRMPIAVGLRCDGDTNISSLCNCPIPPSPLP
jgi:hypothetical protein